MVLVTPLAVGGRDSDVGAHTVGGDRGERHRVHLKETVKHISIRQEDQMTKGAGEQGSRGAGNQWTSGLADHGTRERGDQRTKGPVPGSTTHAVFQEPGTSWFTTRTSVFRFPPLRRATYQRVHGEGGPQRHAGLLAVAADEGLLVQDTVALVDLQHLGPAEGDVLPLHCLHLKRGEVRCGQLSSGGVG